MKHDVTIWPEYKAIFKFYGTRTAKRSGVLLMNHIVEGLKIMEEIGSTTDAMKAFCLHPIFQNDAELATVAEEYMSQGNVSVRPIMLTMEYRQWANDWLSGKVLKGRNQFILTGRPSPGPLEEVRDMLIADKVQNRKDFITYHKGTHQKSDELDHYFKVWLDELGIDEVQYDYLCDMIG